MMPSFEKPEIAAEMRIRPVHQYSTHPTSYEVLLYTKGDRGWQALRMSDGTRALFTHPPLSEKDARDAIDRFETRRDVRLTS